MAEDDRKLYVGGLPFKLTKEHLFDMFEKYGKVEDAFIIKDRESGRSRGFGFVIFENEECMEEAIDGLHDTDMDGRKLVVQKAGKRRGGGGGGGGYRRGGGGGGYRGGGGGGYRGNRDYGGRSGGGGGAYGGGGGGGRYGSRDNGY